MLNRVVQQSVWQSVIQGFGWQPVVHVFVEEIQAGSNATSLTRCGTPDQKIQAASCFAQALNAGNASAGSPNIILPILAVACSTQKLL